MSHRHKFIYFDLDDTLLDHKSAERNALADIYDHFKWSDSIELDQLINTYHEVNKALWKLYGEVKVTREKLQRDRFEITMNKLGLDGSRYAEVGSYYMRCYRKHWTWVDGAENTFHTIREQYPVGVLTNGFSETQKKKFEKFDFHRFTNQLVISEDVGYLKPDPRIFEHATNITDYKAEEILYIGDSLNSDVIGGTSYGWNVAWYTNGGNDDGRDRAAFVFSDFDDLLNFLAI